MLALGLWSNKQGGNLPISFCILKKRRGICWIIIYISISYKEVSLEANHFFRFLFITSRLSDRLQISVAPSGYHCEAQYGVYKWTPKESLCGDKALNAHQPTHNLTWGSGETAVITLMHFLHQSCLWVPLPQQVAVRVPPKAGCPPCWEERLSPGSDLWLDTRKALAAVGALEAFKIKGAFWKQDYFYYRDDVKLFILLGISSNHLIIILVVFIAYILRAQLCEWMKDCLLPISLYKQPGALSALNIYPEVGWVCVGSGERLWKQKELLPQFSFKTFVHT